MNICALVAERLNLPAATVDRVFRLLDESHTIPFLARYRKEATGNLDEVILLALRDERERLEELDKRQAAILESLKTTGHWTAERESEVLAFRNRAELEDYFLPFRPKRQTRASVALEQGLGPLADQIQQNREPSAEQIRRHLDQTASPLEPSQAWAGAQDIVSERISESSVVRARLRERFAREGRVVSSQARGAPTSHPYVELVGKSEPLATLPGHRLLALLRGEAEKFVRLSVEIDPEGARRDLCRILIPTGSPPVASLGAAIDDSLKRLLGPSLETEALREARQKAEAGAIRVFSENVRQLLLAAPLGQQAILAVDPGLRTGCKTVVLSAQGNLVEHGVIYALEPHRKTADAEKLVRAAVERYRLKAIAVGNGTGGREAEAWLRSLGLPIPVFSVNESGASVYSASEVAREEFPEYDLTVRGAVSIGRRLLDPLAELVKIDPKSIGVGQYQHDVNQKLLKQSLDDVVISCVNRVGVDVNTATKSILTYVSGLNPKLAAAILEYRTAQGPFRRRSDLLRVKGLGPKAFEQAAGFLRIHGGEEPLDASGVHPESYPVVGQLAKLANCEVKDLLGKDLRSTMTQMSSLGVGEATLKDILLELERPGRDPRPALEVTLFDEGTTKLSDLYEGQILKGIITNVTDFGAFVDLGVHQDGLIHISQLADTYVKHPLDVVKPGQTVTVKVLSVDLDRKRIGLGRKGLN